VLYVRQPIIPAQSQVSQFSTLTEFAQGPP